MKYLLRIRQVALAGFHFTYETQDKLGEEEERETREKDGEGKRQREE